MGSIASGVRSREMAVMLSGKVYSSRDKVNVNIPGTQFWGEGNHIFNRPSGHILDAIRRMIKDVLTEELEIGREYRRKVAVCYNTPRNEISPGDNGYGIGAWAENEYTISVSTSYERGVYVFYVSQDSEV
jgi:hypothetical protein